MNMNELYKRRIRIENKPDEKLAGYMVTVKDIETGEMVPGVSGITLRLTPQDINRAVLTYYEKDANGKYVIEQEKPVQKTVTIDNPEVAVTANEQITYHEVLKAFAEYADRITYVTFGTQVPALTLYRDGSGKVHDEKSGTFYKIFTDLYGLLTWLQEKPDA